MRMIYMLYIDMLYIVIKGKTREKAGKSGENRVEYRKRCEKQIKRQKIQKCAHTIKTIWLRTAETAILFRKTRVLRNNMG